MIAAQIANSVELDRLDAQIVRGLQLSPRVPFRQLADVLEVSEQTVARRYRALQRNGVLRVIAIVDPTALGESDWFVRVKTRPEATLDLGRALGQRADIAWVSVSAGGSELVCAVRSHSQEQREQLLLDRLPRTAAVLDLSASVILRRFVGGSASDWMGLHDVLTTEQQARIAGDAEPRREPRPGTVLTSSDYAMLRVLATDGRAPIGALARAADCSPGRAGRRLDALLSSGVLYQDVDLAAAALGYRTSAYLWLTVAPSRLHETCAALSTHRETPFVAAITGRANVVASVTCRGLSDLYTYVTERIGALDGVQSLEVSPILRRLKQAGTLMDGDRLVAP